MSPLQSHRRLVGTSLKMYFDLPQTQAYITSALRLGPLAESANIDLFIIPDFLSIPTAHSLLTNHAPSIILGAQDTSPHTSGPHTGDVSPRSLAQAGVKLVEIGHAERRAAHSETDADVAAKATAVVAHGMIPLVCVGERTPPTASSGDASVPVHVQADKAMSEFGPQVEAVLDAIPDDAELVLAYEPVWAIGAAEPADAAYVVAVGKGLKRRVQHRKGRTRILYGGSAGPGTFAKIKDGVDGLFLGRFAHDVKNLEQVIREMSE